MNVNFSPFPILHTERFVLRSLRLEDDKELFVLRTDPRINEFLNREPPGSLEDVRAFINKILENTQKGESILWAVCANGEGSLSGTICLWKISPAEEKAEIGYELLQQYHGKGIMQEVIPEVIRFGFETLGLKVIEAELEKANVKSVKLLEKNGFVKDMSAENDQSPLVIFTLRRFSKPSPAN